MKKKTEYWLHGFLLAILLAVLLMPLSVHATEAVTGTEEYPLKCDMSLWELDWRNASEEMINHYLGMAEWQEIGAWLIDMSEEERQELLQMDTLLVQPTFVTEEVTKEESELLFYEYALSRANEPVAYARAYPSTTSGYWTTKIVKLNMAGVAVNTAVITHKISGIDTTVPTSETQNVTMTQTVQGNWCNINVAGSNHSNLYRFEDTDGTYNLARSVMGFDKPAGYTVNVTYSTTKNAYALFWNPTDTFKTGHSFFESQFQNTISRSGLERKSYPQSVIYNGVNTAGFLKSEASVRHYPLALVNVYMNAGIGTTANASNGNLVQTITLIPSAYNVNYNGNGATGGMVSSQNCFFDQLYTAQGNGFSKAYKVSYDAEGGSVNEAGSQAQYVFKGWGLNQNTRVDYAAGASYKSLTSVNGGVVTMHAIWSPSSVKLPEAERRGYQFDGWDIGKAGTSYTPVKDVTAHAKWIANQYTVILDADGGVIAGENNEVKIKSLSAVYDREILLPTPKKSGYTFSGWKGQNGTYDETANNLTTENNGKVTLYATWTANENTPYTIRRFYQPHAQAGSLTEYLPFSYEKGFPYPAEEIRFGTTDVTLTIPAGEVEGYVTPDAQLITVAGDGSTVVNFYYKPNIIAAGEEENQSIQMKINGVEYEVKKKADGTLGICFLKSDREKILLPDWVKIDDKIYRITEIYDYAFKNNDKIKKIELSSDISKIGNQAFANCKNLQKVILHNGIISIGSRAFDGCSSLTSLSVPATVQSIGNYAFRNCKSLKTVKLNEGLITIGARAFYRCTALTKVKIPRTVLEIGNYAFAGNENLKACTFAGGCKLLSLGQGAFSGCRKLSRITLPAKLTSIQKKTFYNCKKLKTVKIGGAVTSIGAGAFSNCEKITSLTVPSKVQTIGKNAFFQCNSLKKVSVKSKALTSIGDKAFKKCKKGIRFVVPKAKKESYQALFKGKY